jgi:hypothetical protein
MLLEDLRFEIFICFDSSLDRGVSHILCRFLICNFKFIERDWFGPAMFLFYHSERCNIYETVFRKCYANNLYTTCSGVLGQHLNLGKLATPFYRQRYYKR